MASQKRLHSAYVASECEQRCYKTPEYVAESANYEEISYVTAVLAA